MSEQSTRMPLARTPREIGNRLGMVMLRELRPDLADSESDYQAIGRKEAPNWFRDADKEAEFLAGWDARWSEQKEASSE